MANNDLPVDNVLLISQKLRKTLHLQLFIRGEGNHRSKLTSDVAGELSDTSVSCEETRSNSQAIVFSPLEQQVLRRRNAITENMGRDLSQVTNRLWKTFYQIEFGEKSINQVVERMKQRKVTFKWKQLYEAKTKEVAETQQRSFERIKELYQKEDAKRQSRQVQVCTKVPPSSNKRSFYGSGPGSSFGNTKSSLMKKAKIEFVNSREVKNLAAMKNKGVQRTHRFWLFEPRCGMHHKKT
ncbi:uncharacterized protein LOC132620166 [Lycium barbarum]|uniref:uncharacterized protein LOC132620166 n=1 Tax=Lycium barbarum TaxID=112863 RepID=UPI00293EFD85|nr:uncharacterized protein LOC132620166 [Lycium barbarum]